MNFLKKLKRLIFFIIIIGFIACAIIIKQGYDMYKAAIAKISIEDKISPIQNSDNFTKLNDVSTDFTNAILAVEDHRFYDHGAIDIIGIGRSIVVNFKKNKLASGGSTITQQLAKNLYFSQEKKFTRKVAELFLAYDLEKIYAKDEILELYINTLYFGDGYYGISDASYGYFNKSPNDLSLDESTLLAGLPNAPSVYALSNNNTHTYERQKLVIDAMIKYGFITENDAKAGLENYN